MMGAEQTGMRKKIAMIGAGSVVFCKTLMSDIMATPVLNNQPSAICNLVVACHIYGI